MTLHGLDILLHWIILMPLPLVRLRNNAKSPRGILVRAGTVYVL